MLTPSDLKDRLIRSGLCPADKLRGCSDKELMKIEEHIGCRLPQSYKDVTRVIGRGAGDFISDVEMYYPAVVTLTEQDRELLAESVDLPDDAFVFADRDGEQLLFFHTATDSDDPPIYRWHDGEPRRFRKVFKSIWDFIEEELVAHESLLEDR